MSLSTLQRAAFTNSADFTAQVNGIVVEQALYKNDIWKQANKLDASTQTQLGQVARNPGNYGFASTIVNDSTWDVSYDTWAEDPPAAKGAIEGRVQKYWALLTGIEEPV